MALVLRGRTDKWTKNTIMAMAPDHGTDGLRKVIAADIILRRHTALDCREVCHRHLVVRAGRVLQTMDGLAPSYEHSVS